MIKSCKKSINTNIRRMADMIVKKCSPEKIILFGSRAYGKGGKDSDVDLLVIMPLNGTKHSAAVDIRVALHNISISKDIIVTTPEDFKWRKEIVGTIERAAYLKGEVLYARI